MPRYPFRKPRDLYPEILERFRQEEATRVATEAKWAAEKAAAAAAAAEQNAAAEVAANPHSSQPSLTASSAPQTLSSSPAEAQSSNENPPPSPAVTRSKSTRRRSGAKSKSRLASASSQPESDFERHSRKCLVCKHPDRETIEELFINWHSPQSIEIEFDGRYRLDWSSIYRHARAAGLYPKRRANLRAVLELVLEHADDVAPTAQGIVAVLRAYTCLTESNEWVEPERRVQVTNHYRRELPAHSGPSSTEPPAAFRQSAGAVPLTAAGPDENQCTDSTSVSAVAQTGLAHTSSVHQRSPEAANLPPTVPSASDRSGACHHARKNESSPSSRTGSVLVATAESNASPYTGSSLVNGHSSLSSNRQSPELKSPPTHT